MEQTANRGKKKNRINWQTSRKERVSYYLGLGGARMMQSIASGNLATYMIFLGIDIKLIAGLMLGMNANKWHINGGHTGGDAGFVGTNSTGGSWYTSCLKNPTDMLGRKWSPELNGGGVLMPEINGIGLLKMEPDLHLKVVGNTEHNYAMLMLNQHPITHIEGAIHIHCVEGVACPPEDVEALEVSSVRDNGNDGKRYSMEYSLKDSAYKFHSVEEIAVQAATKAVIMERFKDIDQFSWQFAPQPATNTYTWYGYEAGQVLEHWDGPTGNEKYIVAVHKK
mgnify:CR=1 FL=1